MNSWGYILLGLVLAFAGAIIATAAAQQDGVEVIVWAGWVMAGLGSLCVSIGAIAQGVKIGNEETRRRP